MLKTGRALRSSYGKLAHLGDSLGELEFPGGPDDVDRLTEQLREVRHWARVAWLLADEELTAQMVDPPDWLTEDHEKDVVRSARLASIAPKGVMSTGTFDP